MDALVTIALLCQVSIGAMGISIEKVRDAQVTCHKYYVECLTNKVAAKEQPTTTATEILPVSLAMVGNTAVTIRPPTKPVPPQPLISPLEKMLMECTAERTK